MEELFWQLLSWRVTAKAVVAFAICFDVPSDRVCVVCADVAVVKGEENYLKCAQVSHHDAVHLMPKMLDDSAPQNLRYLRLFRAKDQRWRREYLWGPPWLVDVYLVLVGREVKLSPGCQYTRPRLTHSRIYTGHTLYLCDMAVRLHRNLAIRGKL